MDNLKKVRHARQRGNHRVTSGHRRKDSSTRVESSPCLHTLHGTPSPVKTRAGSQNGAAPRLHSDMHGRSPKVALGVRKVAVARSGPGGSLVGGHNSAAEGSCAVVATVGVGGVLSARGASGTPLQSR